MGKLVYSDYFKENNRIEKKISFKEYSRGIYLLNISYEGKRITKKIIYN